jgi:hypothetical protein
MQEETEAYVNNAAILVKGLAQSVIVGIPAQIANIEYKVTISGRAPSRYKKREEATRNRKTAQARTTDPT